MNNFHTFHQFISEIYKYLYVFRVIFKFFQFCPKSHNDNKVPILEKNFFQRSNPVQRRTGKGENVNIQIFVNKPKLSQYLSKKYLWPQRFLCGTMKYEIIAISIPILKISLKLKIFIFPCERDICTFISGLRDISESRDKSKDISRDICENFKDIFHVLVPFPLTKMFNQNKPGRPLADNSS